MAKSKGSEPPPLDPGVPTLGEEQQLIKKRRTRKRRILIYIVGFAMLLLTIILVVVELVVVHHAKADVFIDWPSTQYIFVLYVPFEGMV
jgi:predicted nucleic acid-binding Zn ribbon protein